MRRDGPAGSSLSRRCAPRRAASGPSASMISSADLHQHCALTDQSMASARERIVDRARDREHLAALIAGAARGDQRARAQARFDDERAERKAGDDPVAARKILGPSRSAGRELADQRTARRDARGELAVASRKDEIGAGAEHRDRDCARVERGGVRGGIDAFGEPARDRKTRRDERARETARVVKTAVACVAAADDRDLRSPERARLADRRTARRARPARREAAAGNRRSSAVSSGCLSAASQSRSLAICAMIRCTQRIAACAAIAPEIGPHSLRRAASSAASARRHGDRSARAAAMRRVPVRAAGSATLRFRRDWIRCPSTPSLATPKTNAARCCHRAA